MQYEILTAGDTQGIKNSLNELSEMGCDIKDIQLSLSPSRIAALVSYEGKSIDELHEIKAGKNAEIAAKNAEKERKEAGEAAKKAEEAKQNDIKELKKRADEAEKLKKKAENEAAQLRVEKERADADKVKAFKNR